MSNNLPLFAQADLLFLMAKLFAYPTSETRAFLAETNSTIDQLITQTDLKEITKLNELYQQFYQQASTIDLGDWQLEYNFLFEAGVTCAINETGYVRRDKGAILADIAGFYRAFNMQLAENATEKGDHLICELEFAALLLVMLAKSETEEDRTVTFDALSAFCFDHLSEWMTLFCQKLATTSGLLLYSYLAELLEASWKGIVEFNHLPVAELNPRKIIPIAEDTDTPYECDMAEQMH